MSKDSNAPGILSSIKNRILSSEGGNNSSSGIFMSSNYLAQILSKSGDSVHIKKITFHLSKLTQEEAFD